jgi:hypothetical protein
MLRQAQHSTALLKRKPGPPGVYKGTPGVGLSTGGTDRRAAQLIRRRHMTKGQQAMAWASKRTICHNTAKKGSAN